MTSAVSILALGFYKQTVARRKDVFSIEEIEEMLKAAFEETAGVGADMEKRARERAPA